MKIMKWALRILIVLFSITLFTTACRQSSQKAGDQESDQRMIDQQDIEKGLKDMANPLPEPFEVYSMLEDIGASYLGKILNSPSNADVYFTQKSKALNIGVYAADLAYAVTYNNKEDIKTYSLVLKSILDDLKVPVNYAALQDETMKQNLMDKDSLIDYVSKVYYNTYSFLYKESTPSLSALMAAGAWVEGLYIASHISDDTYQNYEIVKIIYNQGASLGELINFMEKFKDDEMVASLQDAFKKLKVLYDETEGSLTKKQLDDIVMAIETIRDSIIS